MRFRVEFAAAASAQVEAAAAWWRANRGAAPSLFEDELAFAIDLLSSMPPLTEVWAVLDGREVRKLRLPRTRHALFFTIEGDLVVVHALWHGARGEGPPLRRA